MLDTDQSITGTGITTCWKLTYTGLVVKDSDGVSYTLNGTVYARIAISLSPIGFNFILTSKDMNITSSTLSGPCDFDYAINVSSSGYTCSGRVGTYTVSNSFNLAS